MTSFHAELVNYRLERAKETLAEARTLFDAGHTVGVVNRLYYACFYAVNALLLSEGLSSAKHSGVRALFNKHWIKPGRLPVEIGAFYNQLFERRQAGDYRDIVSFDPADVGKWLGESERFIESVASLLRDNA
jgi:uncharacterized protein (UPF0332 family)